MANIAITKYCNLKCPYCFAEKMMEEEKQNIKIEMLLKILDWLKDSDERIGIIGGEPTLHPNFGEILKIINNYCEEYNRDSILFTNGINLKKYIQYLSPKMSILLNINSPRIMTNEQWENLNEILNILYLKNKLQGNNAQVTCGCNLCLEIDNYDFFWSLIDKYKIDHVRVSVTAPIKEAYLNNKDLYYLKLKPIFLNFIKEAYKRKIFIVIDCNHLPKCYFTEDEYLLIKKVCINFCDYCEPCIDITADFKASSCFGTYDSLIECNLFNNCEELKNYFQKKILYEKINNIKNQKCQECEDFQLKKCQGGCLSFKF